MDDSILIAAQAGFSSLYHYRDFDLTRACHVDRLVDILRNHRIYCSNPADFNDPWDCKPYFDPALLDDPAHHTATAEALIANQRGGPKGSKTDHLLRTNPAFLKRAMESFSEFEVDYIAKRWGVFCLSPDPSITLMWSHYSRNHRGICLEFSLDNSKFCLAQRVRYQKDYPPFLLHDPRTYMNMLIVKSYVWAYEQEFRLICPRSTPVKDQPLILEGDKLTIGPNDLKSIIVGCQADDETVKAVKTLVKEHAPGVTVWQAKRAPNKYTLVIEG